MGCAWPLADAATARASAVAANTLPRGCFSHLTSVPLCCVSRSGSANLSPPRDSVKLYATIGRRCERTSRGRVMISKRQLGQGVAGVLASLLLADDAHARARAREQAPAYKDPAAPLETRVEDLLARMTLDEKI